ncbi:MAG TPA: aspartate/glutamate racemase family protein, partial [Spirochaetia bacterium]|nr:aspartate/glutamate racemase family protein [Spirochaetia bacterium]
NETVAARLGGLHSAKCLMYSVDFAEIELLQREGRWEEATEAMIDCGRRLAAGGADFIVICTNTMHKMAEAVARETGLPLLHIADATSQKIVAEGYRKVGLLGTRFTMEEEFYAKRLEEGFELEVLIPEARDRETLHRVIYDELVKGIINPKSRESLLRIIERLASRGAQCVALACTEIGLLVKQSDTPLPLFDTALIHAQAAAETALPA